MELAKVSDDLKQFLRSQQIQKQMPAFLEKFKAKETPKATTAKSSNKENAPELDKKRTTAGDERLLFVW